MKSFWIDELLSIEMARQIRGLRSFFVGDPANWHPPFYFLLLKGWLLLGQDESWARLLSVLFGIAVVPATFILALELFPIGVSVLSSILVSVSPLFLLYDREVRNYPLFTLLSVISLFYFVRALREGRRRDWVGYIVLTVLNIYTHYHGVLLVLGEMTYFVICLRSYRRRVRDLLASLGIVSLSVFPLIPALSGHLYQVSGLEAQGGRFPVALGYISKPLYIGFAFSLGQTVLPWQPAAIVGGIVALGLAVNGLGGLFREREKTVFFGACLLMPVVVGTLYSDPMPRYYLFLAPLFYMILAFGIVNVRYPMVRVGMALVLAVVWALGIGNYYANREFHILSHVNPWREVGQFLRANMTDGDAVVHVALRPAIGMDPVSYYVGLPIPLYEADVLATLPRITSNGSIPRVWLMVSESTLQEVGRAASSWLARRYSACRVWRYFHDPDYEFKKRFFRKDFAEYRIQVFLFETPRSELMPGAACL